MQYEDLFHLPEDVTFLNCAYMAPLLKSVENVGIQAIRRRRNLHAIKAEDFFTDVNDLREEFAGLINVPAASIALIPSVSYGIANVARNLPMSAGQNIIMPGAQFPSNYYPWQRLADDNKLHLHIIEPPATDSNRAVQWNERLLESIDESTACVAISVTHWADGTKFDLPALRARTQEVGAWLVIDGTQSVGALPFDCSQIRPDALICAGYKWLMGPYSLGLAYYGESMIDGTPVEENWINRLESEDFQGLVNYTHEYQPGHMRYSVGEHSNFTLVPMLLTSIRTVREITPEYVQEHTARITDKAFQNLINMGFRIEDSSNRGNHLVGIRLPEHADAHLCAEELKKAGIIVSWRGESLRISPHVYNTEHDLALLTDVLTESVKIGA